MSAAEVRAVPEADWPAAYGLAQEAFGSPGGDAATTEANRARWLASVAHSATVGAYDGGRLVSFARVRPYQQWFGGRPVPMAGLASVYVTASHQRRGVARATVRAALAAARERGLVVSALFPTTVPLYRGLGWEPAGDYTWLAVPGALLRALGPVEGVTLRPAVEGDLPGIFAAYRRLCAETNGLLERSGPQFDLRPETVLPGALVAEGAEGIEGYARADRRRAGHHVDVEAWDVVATTPAGARALWFALGAGASTVETVRAKVAADDVLPLLAEPRVTVHEHLRWMLRLVDAPAAVAARGWPGGVRARVDLDVRDDEIPANAGRWRLTVEDGAGSLTPGGEGTVALGVGALSALYAGGADPRALRRTGLLSCADESAIDALAAATAGPRARLLDYF